MQNRGAYGQSLPQGYDSRTARKPVQRRVVDFTSTVARNLQARSHPAPAARFPSPRTAHTPLHTKQQLRMMQGDSWDEPTLLPTQGAALDVRARVSVRRCKRS